MPGRIICCVIPRMAQRREGSAKFAKRREGDGQQGFATQLEFLDVTESDSADDTAKTGSRRLSDSVTSRNSNCVAKPANGVR
jgi:hypothetical protein